MNIEFTTQIFKEGRMYVAYAPQLDVSSCATTEAKAQKNLIEAVRLFLEEAKRKGSLDKILGKFRFINERATTIISALINEPVEQAEDFSPMRERGVMQTARMFRACVSRRQKRVMK